MLNRIVTRPGRYPDTVEAHSVLCYRAARQLGISTLELSKRLGVSQATASQAVKPGEKTADEHNAVKNNCNSGIWVED